MRRSRKLLAAGLGGLLALTVPGAAQAGTGEPPAHSSAPAGRTGQAASTMDRGLTAVSTARGVLVSWRLFADEPRDVGFDVYRGGHKLNEQPIVDSTNFLDRGGTPDSVYRLRVAGSRTEKTVTTRTWSAPHRDIPLDKPAGGTTPDGVDHTYRANDASVGDLDGDGQYEIVLKWDPTNSHDNSQEGYTGEVFLDAYELDGTRLWRIGLGPNVRAGAHYTQFLVYDFDGDGLSEVVFKTADGTVDGTGRVIGDPNADHRNDRGRVLTGPEYLTVFDGRTGKALATTDFAPARGDLCDWGDCYGNRGKRFLAAVAYLDGEHPSIVMGRGYYAKTMVSTFDWRGGELRHRWTFDSEAPGNGDYAGQGNHNLSVADVDDDGRDEIVYGGMALDDDGTGLYTTGLGHGDAMHLGDLDPARPGLEVFGVHENTDSALGVEFRDADSGEALWGVRTGKDTGRGLTADIDPDHPGAEAWATGGAWNSPTGYLRSAQGKEISTTIPPANFAVWWDGDLGRELLDHDYDASSGTGTGRIDDWNPGTKSLENLLTATGTTSINGTKGNPSLQADILGDWREEVLWPTEDSTSLRLYSTPHPTEHRLPSLMQDHVYRMGVAWQNVAYNQPPHTGYYLGWGM
ncbi:hypothetical protein FHX42_003819 [Saccharopolyspora lacisalsi]|uniref:Rhamnogalacturonan lyase n=1 Tax=Halosaccharopolyspora lacisalsi TaxID=1000566 RepID=A0A839DZK2_9PSEU|nr:rhamnogalacturonan lyase [Halosaccharopolyspora lacisalsi]MBA8826443.1 hypothetical protein [Halosaccharopolyspora lacisalsi]